MIYSKKIHLLLDKMFRDIEDLPKIIRDTIPSINITENQNYVLIDVAAPGMHKSDFKIDVEANVLTISCNKIKKENSDKTHNERIEYDYSSFSRSITLPDNINKPDIRAKYEDGILHIVVPKKEKKDDNVKINID